jgi:hypothetical protein
MTASPEDPVEEQEPHSVWLTIPLGMILIVLGGIVFCVVFAIAAVIDGLTAIFQVIVTMIYLLLWFPAAAIERSHHHSK